MAFQPEGEPSLCENCRIAIDPAWHRCPNCGHALQPISWVSCTGCVFLIGLGMAALGFFLNCAATIGAGEPTHDIGWYVMWGGLAVAIVAAVVAIIKRLRRS